MNGQTSHPLSYCTWHHPMQEDMRHPPKQRIHLHDHSNLACSEIQNVNVVVSIPFSSIFKHCMIWWTCCTLLSSRWEYHPTHQPSHKQVIFLGFPHRWWLSASETRIHPKDLVVSTVSQSFEVDSFMGYHLLQPWDDCGPSTSARRPFPKRRQDGCTCWPFGRFVPAQGVWQEMKGTTLDLLSV